MSYLKYLVVIALIAIASVITPAGAQNARLTKVVTSSKIGWSGDLLVQLHVRDLDRAIQFYKDVLGFELYEYNSELQWAKLWSPVLNVEIGVGVAPKDFGSGGVSLNFGVTDIDVAREELESRGVVFKSPTITIPNIVHLLDLTDPDGNRIRIAQAL